MVRREEIEIMAPVGSYESLAAAMQSGADSIYFGVQGLNMRSQSSANFTLEDLERIVATCKESGVKSYLTVNTVIYDQEIPYMHSVIDCAKRAGVDAVIASDQATIIYCRQRDVEVHISTQLNISNVESVKFYATYADVVVLARELDIDKVRYIYDAIERENITGPRGEKIRIEMFSHGALCMAVSGKCYLSLHDANVSANRGSCRQICRRAYDVKDRDTGAELVVDNKYIMSPKDLSTISFLDKLIDSGVRVLKIEGRARGAEYVKRVCSCYDEAIRAIEDGSYSQEKIDGWQERLSTVFNRGFWGGYYLGHKLGEWSESYGSSATKRKVYVGKVTNFFKNISVAEVQIEASTLKSGDEVIFIGETTGVVEMVIDELRVDLKIVDVAEKGVRCSLKCEELLRRGDKLYMLVASK